MKEENKQIIIFKGQKIRRIWDEKKVVDIIAVLVE